MPDALPVGPYRTLNGPGGLQIPYYIITFDKEGRCTSPQTRAHLLAHAGDRTDIFLFSHGWNNDWTVATKRYQSFIEGFMQMRQAQGLPTPPGYAPLLVGIFWPSAVLVADDEQGPQIAGGDAATDAAVADERAAVAEIAERLPAGSVERFYELAQREALTADEALELARILLPIYKDGESELSSGAPTAEELVAGWRAASTDPDGDADPEDFGTATSTAGGGPQAAGFLGTIRDLGRNAIRGTTVWMMKDRAGRVGARGVSPLLVDLLQGSTARVHLIGHSYGGKVVLSALCAPASLPRKAHSMLLLQPAVSHLCFADTVPVRNVPGGYRSALQRVERPILTTFSRKDVPLTKAFHLAVVRPSDLGEIKIAAAGDPPNWFAALGGFGPRRAGEKLIDMRLPPSAYTLDPATHIYGLRGDATISGHGDISNPSTWWALHTLVGA
jgi:pimeloyl-ACP methyl ester carboxylesterase